jgi:3,2-trans-enoyl-CoA isomerase
MSLTTEIKKNYAIVTIKRDPVNSMNLELWMELQNTLDSLEANSKMRGVIFCSGLERDIFTAGNDLMELYAPKSSRERYQKFWTLSNQFLANLYNSRLVTVAAINGSCPAGGCVLSLCCDYRVAVENATMGLNETALGIPVPAYWVKLLGTIVGPAVADKMAQFAQMIPARQGIKMGLVDQIVPTRAELMNTSETVINQVRSSYVAVEDT